MKFESWEPEEEKRKWKIVRRDNCANVEGRIIAADEDTGECCLFVAGGAQPFSFGPKGFWIVKRGR